MNVKDISVLLKHHSKKDSGTILEPSNIEKCTELSKYTQSLKSRGIRPILARSIVKGGNSKTSAKFCKLCLTEKFYIIRSLDDKNFPIKKAELVNKFRRQKKLLLSNVKRNDTIN